MVFSALAGQIADRTETSFMMRLTKFIELVVMAVAAIGFFTGSGGVLVLALFAMGAQSAFFSPVRIAAMPKYMRADELIRANALFNGALYVCILAGLFIGGILIDTDNGARILAGALFVTALLGWLASLGGTKSTSDAPELTVRYNIVAQTIRIVSLALRDPGVGWPLIGVAVFFYCTTLITVLTPIYIADVWSSDAGTANAIMGIFAIGAGLGAASAALIIRKGRGLSVAAFGVSMATLLSVVCFMIGAFSGPADGETLSFATFFARTDTVILAIALCATAAGLGLFTVPLQAAIQRRGPAQSSSPNYGGWKRPQCDWCCWRLPFCSGRD